MLKLLLIGVERNKLIYLHYMLINRINKHKRKEKIKKK